MDYGMSQIYVQGQQMVYRPDASDRGLTVFAGGHASEAEVSYEAFYRFDIAPGLAIKPFVGFMSHPDQATAVTPSGNDTHAIYLGALLVVDLAHMFGLPALSP